MNEAEKQWGQDQSIRELAIRQARQRVEQGDPSDSTVQLLTELVAEIRELRAELYGPDPGDAAGFNERLGQEES